MANLKSSIKDIRRTKTRTQRNKHVITGIRTINKKARTTNDANDYALAYKKIDSAAAKGKIHKNKANRMKSRLMKHLNQKNKVVNETKAK
jgi:small subunit ribosomal protein S20